MPNLDGEVFAQPLAIHFAAYLAVKGETPESELSELLNQMAVHERLVWRQRLGNDRVAFEAFSNVVVTLTLLGGVTCNESLNILIASSGDLTKHQALIIGDHLGGIFGTNPTNGLHPDLLGEYVVAEWLRRDTELLERMLPAKLGTVPFEILGRIDLNGLSDRVPMWCERLLRADFGERANDALEAAKSLGTTGVSAPVGGAIATVLVERNDVEVATELEKALPTPDRTTALRDLGEVVVRILRENARSEVSKARLTTNHSVWLSAVGKHDSALTAAKKAVALYRTLSDGASDSYQSELAGALGNLGVRQSEARMHTDALASVREAVNIRRGLADTQPDEFLADYMMALNNLAGILGETGEHDEALVAIRTAVEYGQKIEALQGRPLPDLAMLLTTLGVGLSQVGKWQEALAATTDAVERRRRSAEAQPDAFLPELAGAVNNLSAMYSSAGLRNEALDAANEAVRLYRTLIQKLPEAFKQDLAMALTNLGNMLGLVGRPSDALAASREAVDRYRSLQKSRPGACLPELAQTLGNLGKTLVSTGDAAEALSVTREAVEIYQGLPEDTFLPDLALVLTNLGAIWADVGEPENALETSEQAVKTYRKLAAVNPGAHSTHLAGALSNFGRMLISAGKKQQGRCALVAAVKLFREDGPRDADLSNFAMALLNLGDVLRSEGRLEGALVAVRDAVGIFRSLGGEAPNLANALINLALILNGQELREEAFDATREVVGLFRQLADDLPEVFLPDLASALGDMALALLGRADLRGASAATLEMVDLYRGLAGKQPETFCPKLAKGLGLRGHILRDSRLDDEAALAFREGLGCIWPFFETDPQSFGLLAGALIKECILCARGQLDEVLRQRMRLLNAYAGDAGRISAASSQP